MRRTRVHNRPGVPGRSGPPARAERGLTVLELIVTLAVVGFLMIAGYNGVRYVSKSNLREDTTQVAAVLRAAFNMAAVTGMHHRVVFNLDEQTFRVEACEGNIALRMQAREEALEAADGDIDAALAAARDALPPGVAQAMSPEDATRMAGALSGTTVNGAQCKPPELPTGDADGRGAERRVRTERDIKIRRILVQHLEDEQTEGIVHVNFFPQGRGEKAVIDIADEDDNQFTLLVHGLTSRIEFRDDRVDADHHMRRRADGEEVDER